MQFKLNSKLIIRNVSDQSGVLVFVCFSSKALYFHASLSPVLVKINNSSLLRKDQVESWLVDLCVEDKVKFWNTLINNCVLIESEID
ncbi:hypothetical protein L0668_06400 [Paraglaciecola aquimarina]|uniref:Uncharacterized protein n=1 Tax=Paraglaciecola algarum TaxID=3050085 RepID=A0ABS9D463_9ALTE|nr:hypothetical protein [Paraglaciecola sp. G1-23]MCF2947728.1 hypothetical protein [Paraglaciecola sp. G1-23]